MSAQARVILIKLPTGKRKPPNSPRPTPEVTRIRTYLQHPGTRASRQPRRRRGEHSRPRLPLPLLLLFLLRADPSHRQLASSPRHGPEANKNSDRQPGSDHISDTLHARVARGRTEAGRVGGGAAAAGCCCGA